MSEAPRRRICMVAYCYRQTIYHSPVCVRHWTLLPHAWRVGRATTALLIATAWRHEAEGR